MGNRYFVINDTAMEDWFRNRKINPFLFLDVEVDCLEKVLTERIKNPDEVPVYKVYLQMHRFAEIYEAFRPHSITHSDPYRGTVGIMDKIYNTLFPYLQIPFEHELVFSKQWPSFFDSLNRKRAMVEFKDANIPWEELLEDLRFVQEAIKEQAKMEAEEFALKFPKLIWVVRHWLKDFEKETLNKG